MPANVRKLYNCIQSVWCQSNGFKVNLEKEKWCNLHAVVSIYVT